jgi:hypothetical protein
MTSQDYWISIKIIELALHAITRRPRCSVSAVQYDDMNVVTTISAFTVRRISPGVLNVNAFKRSGLCSVILAIWGFDGSYATVSVFSSSWAMSQVPAYESRMLAE